MKFLIVAAFVTNICLTILTVEYPVFFLTFLGMSLFYAYSIFGNSMNLVQDLGPFYWIFRDNGKKGDKILFGKYSGQTVKVHGEELLVMREEDIMGVVES